MASGIILPMVPELPLLPRPAFGQPLPALGEGARPQAFGIDPHAFVFDPQAFGVEPQALRLAPQELRELAQALSARQAPFAAKLPATTSPNKAFRRTAVPARIFISAASAFRRFEVDTSVTRKDCRFTSASAYDASPDGRLATAGDERAEALFAAFNLAISCFAAAMPFMRP